MQRLKFHLYFDDFTRYYINEKEKDDTNNNIDFYSLKMVENRPNEFYTIKILNFYKLNSTLIFT